MCVREEFRRIGLRENLPGTKLLERVILHEIAIDSLTIEGIDLILYAWDARLYVPVSLKERADEVKPVITDEEVEKGLYSQEEQNRNFIEMIVKYFYTLM